MSKEQLDFLGIGDTVIDTFIELIEAWIENDNPEKKRELCMKFGEKLPYKQEVSVKGTGNAINAAHAAMKLGLKAGVVTNIGDDDNGREVLINLQRENLDTVYVTINDNHSTNHNYLLRYKEERTILVHHNEYDYKFPKIDIAPKWVYLSSLASNSLPYHREIVNFLKANPETKLAFQPGTFQIKLGKEELSELYKLSEIFFCNKEEAEKILGIKNDSTTANQEEEISYIKKLLSEINILGPKIVVITDGPKGAYVIDSRTETIETAGSAQFYYGPMYPDIAPPVDRTGAGDSFSATFTVAIIMKKTIEEALSWGPINSMSVVQYIGAQAGHLDMEALQKYLVEAPADYKPKKI